MSPEMKDYIEKLKAEGDFRTEGLYLYTRSAFRELLLSFTVMIFVFVVTSNVYILIVSFTASFLILKIHKTYFAKPYSPYNEWEYVDGEVWRSAYNWLIAPSSCSWDFTSRYTVDGKEYKVRTKLGLGKNGPFMGDHYLL
ncbi:MAG: hypothetical protein HN572_04070 [Kordiimonadaceae bacterium]|nr:hypothetical protein [Kordiimonadaceae bacterium]MBT7582114.1 hypothetical protein [Kordiimonadaceae bacterium]